jgi:hypothetical protein
MDATPRSREATRCFQPGPVIRFHHRHARDTRDSLLRSLLFEESLKEDSELAFLV